MYTLPTKYRSARNKDWFLFNQSPAVKGCSDQDRKRLMMNTTKKKAVAVSTMAAPEAMLR